MYVFMVLFLYVVRSFFMYVCVYSFIGMSLCVSVFIYIVRVCG